MIGKSDNAAFNPMQMPGLSEEARKAATGAFDAMAAWRNEMAAQSERHSAQVFDKMSTAAKAMGWPTEIVDATRTQMQATTRMQTQMMDQVMDAWREQLKSPNPAAAMQSMMAKLQAFPGMGMGAGGGWPGMPGLPGMPGFPGMANMQGMGANPMAFWLQAAEQWQKNWLSIMNTWAQQQGGAGPGGPGAPGGQTGGGSKQTW